MLLKKLYISLLFSIGLISCDDLKKSVNDNFSIENNTSNKIIYNNDTLKLDIKNQKNKVIDSVIYKMNNKIISEFLILKDISLGEKIIKATIYFEDNKQVLIDKITVLNSKTPEIYTYEVINIYDHDITSYTQGLEFYGDILYESTGQYGESKLRALDYKNNRVLKNINLSSSYFGEGLTIFNNKIYQLIS